MIAHWFNHQSPTVKAHIVLLFGILLFINSFQIVYGLNSLILICSALLIWEGLVEAGYWSFVKHWVQSFSKSKK